MVRTMWRFGLALTLVTACGGGAAVTTTSTTAMAPTTAETTPPSSASTTIRAEGEASLAFSGEVQAGTQFEVTWSGPDNEDDFVTIVPAGAAEGAFEDYFYTSVGSIGIIHAPTTAGEYELRYVDGATNATLASEPIVLAGREITLELPLTVVAGTPFEVTWEAIDADRDYITIVSADADAGSYESYFYTADGSTGTLVAPITEGEYEIRFVSGLDAATMAASEIDVTPLEITIEAPASVAADTDFELTWTGPDGPGDYLTVVELGAPDSAYLSYAYTSEGSPLTLKAPPEPGDYEIRYKSDRMSDVFFSVPIEVE